MLQIKCWPFLFPQYLWHTDWRNSCTTTNQKILTIFYNTTYFKFAANYFCDFVIHFKNSLEHHHLENSSTIACNMRLNLTRLSAQCIITSALHCIRTNIPPLACYNFDMCEAIFIISGRNVITKVRNFGPEFLYMYVSKISESARSLRVFGLQKFQCNNINKFPKVNLVDLPNQNKMSFVRYCGQRSSLLWSSVQRPCSNPVLLPGRRKELVGVCDVCARCAGKAGSVWVSSLSGISIACPF